MTDTDHPYGETLPSVSRPQQYTGGEWNLGPPIRGRPRVTLVYPDIYELGMSNFGLAVLRHVLLSSGLFDVRRAFAPAPDLDGKMTAGGMEWVDLEEWEPVRRSRVVGFGIPSEALYTNVLHLVELMGQPLRSCRRGEDAPVILLGGGGLANPLPLAPFADVFFLGEAEERAVELFSVLAGEGSRRDRIEAASAVPGVYVPSLGERPVEFQRTAALRLPDAPVRQLVPNSRISHDRAVVEVARGCTRGCRFCQASQLGRPVRERPVEEAVELMDGILECTGWEKAGLLTLSLSDYSRLPELIEGMEKVALRRHASLSMPSMRPDTILRLGARGDVAGRITIAPEAGTESLRARMNKPMEDGVILDAVEAVFGSGAKGVKMYFMLGLPGETDGDVRAIAELALSAASIARGHGRNPRRSVSVALSPFVPKAQTPLQWAPQMDEGEIMRRTRIVRRMCGRKVALGWNSPRTALIEALLSVGDPAETSEMLEKAVRRGARFDAWTDRLRWDIWKGVMAEHGDLLERNRRGIPPEDPLPWDFITTGVSRDHLLAEYAGYTCGTVTPDCRAAGCAGCGACSGSAAPAGATDRPSPPSGTGSQECMPGRRPAVLRVRFSKRGKARFTSHLDTVRMWGRAVRRSGLPVSWSGGYVTRPRIRFGPPLPLGVESIAEYLDIEIEAPPGADGRGILESCLPEGFGVERTWLLERRVAPPGEGKAAAVYLIPAEDGRWTDEEASASAESLRGQDRVLRVETIEGVGVEFVASACDSESRPDRILSEASVCRETVRRTDILISRNGAEWVSLESFSDDLEKRFLES